MFIKSLNQRKVSQSSLGPDMVTVLERYTGGPLKNRIWYSTAFTNFVRMVCPMSLLYPLINLRLDALLKLESALEIQIDN